MAMQTTTPETRKGRHAANVTTLMQTGGKYAKDRPACAYLTPRRVRMFNALLAGPVTREDMDAIVGASNSPDEVFRCRSRFGLTIPCVRRHGRDRDNCLVEFGVYSLAPTDRPKVLELLAGVAQ